MHFLRDPLPHPDHPAALSDARVLGVGSPFGDDRVGWEVVQRLARGAGGETREHWRGWELRCLDRPGPGLIAAMNGASRVVLIDALHDGGAPGRVVDVDAADLAATGAALSSHHLGVASTLALLAALGDGPRWLRIVGIGIGAQTDGFELSTEVSAAVPRAAARVVRLMR